MNQRDISGLIPSIQWLRSYQKEWLRPDILAGLTAAAVVIPKSMAYATIAGLPACHSQAFTFAQSICI